MTRRLTARLAQLRQERGVAMVLVVFATAMLMLMSLTLIDLVLAESTRSTQAVQKDAAFQAAEAGIDDYIAKLVDDHLYYVHWVHAGESTRRASSGTTTGPGHAWSDGLSWTYPNGKDTWYSGKYGCSACQLANGYEYNLQVTPPAGGASQIDQAIGIVATGRKVGSTTGWRTIQVLVRPSSLADFLMFSASDYTVGSGATTYGKIYVGIDSSGNANDLTHNGIAYGNLYSEGNINGSVTMMGGAQKYDKNTIRTVMKNPANFNDFLGSLADIKSAAQFSGVYLNSGSAAAWKLTFYPNGTFNAKTCTKSGGQNIETVAPSCPGSGTTYNIPPNGAVYTEQSAIVIGNNANGDGVLGRVSVASADDIVVAGNIKPVTPGTDVLGLIATNDVIVAQWCPYDLTWQAAVIAQNGARRSASSDGSHGTATFTGSTATNQKAYMDMFDTRIYNYDPTLQSLQPPWFPTVEDAYTIVLFRELPSP